MSCYLQQKRSPLNRVSESAVTSQESIPSLGIMLQTMISQDVTQDPKDRFERKLKGPKEYVRDGSAIA